MRGNHDGVSGGLRRKNGAFIAHNQKNEITIYSPSMIVSIRAKKYR